MYSSDHPLYSRNILQNILNSLKYSIRIRIARMAYNKLYAYISKRLATVMQSPPAHGKFE